MPPRTIIALLVLIACAESKWDGLKAKWGPAPSSSAYFRDQPRTVEDALDQGFSLVGSGRCNESASFSGIAYAKDGDLSITLLYDVNGFIAGIQGRFSRNSSDVYGFPSVYQQPPFSLDGVTNDTWVITAYFTNPENICTVGRSLDDFNIQGTGDNLWLQNGNDVIAIPHQEEDIQNSSWVLGQCFPTMGVHYWYNATRDMDCDYFFPVFLLYNGGQIYGFGWALGVPLTSPNYEHPTMPILGLFFKDVPQCLAKEAGLSTMHIYLTSDILASTCPA